MYSRSRTGEALAVGEVRGSGIMCMRCRRVVCCTEFERCAGSSLRRPCENIYTVQGVSLQVGACTGILQTSRHE
jgi:Tify domain binding domain